MDKVGEHYIFMCHNRTPDGFAVLNDNGWITWVMASRTAPRNTGKLLLKAITKRAKHYHIKELRLGTIWNNLAMLYCAIKCGFEIEGTTGSGYVLRKDI